jgi:hypothetical protein
VRERQNNVIASGVPMGVLGLVLSALTMVSCATGQEPLPSGVSKEVSDYVKALFAASESSLKKEISASETQVREEIAATEKRLQKEIDDIKPSADTQSHPDGHPPHSEPTKAIRIARVHRQRYPCCCPPWWWD